MFSKQNSLRFARHLWTAVEGSSILRPAQDNICRTVPTSIASSSRLLCTSPSQFTAIPSSSKPSDDVPSKETLLRIDWLLEHVTPNVLKSRMKPFFDVCKPDLIFEDKLYNYKFAQKSHLFAHLAKIRMYFRYKSPFNKVERIGSCIYEGEDVIVLLYRLSSLESSFLTYFPSFITKKEPKINTIEGALDVHVTKEGHVYRIVNRKITASDREGARILSKLKSEQEEVIRKEEEKKLRREAEELVEEQKRKGLL